MHRRRALSRPARSRLRARGAGRRRRDRWACCFSSIVVSSSRSASARISRCWPASARRSCGSARCLRRLLGLDRLFAADHEDGSLDLIVMCRLPLDLAVARQGAGHWLATGLPLVIAAPLLGLLLNLDPARHRRGRAHASRRHAGADLHRPDRRGADGGAAARRLLLAVLVLPLTVPVLIFGVAASTPRSSDRRRSATPFLILCALTLVASCSAPFAAAAALRHGAGMRADMLQLAHLPHCGCRRRGTRISRWPRSISPIRPVSWRFADAAPALARGRDRARLRARALSRLLSRRTTTSRAPPSRSCSSTCRRRGSPCSAGR